MKDVIKCQFTVNENAIGQAIFVAQQWYNKNGLSNRQVTSAAFAGDLVTVEYDKLRPDPGETPELTVDTQEDAAIDVTSDPTPIIDQDEADLMDHMLSQKRKPGRPKRNEH